MSIRSVTCHLLGAIFFSSIIASHAVAAASCQTIYDNFFYPKGEVSYPTCPQLKEGDGHEKISEASIPSPPPGKCCWAKQLCDYSGYKALIDLAPVSNPLAPDCEFRRWERTNCVDNKYCAATAAQTYEGN